MPVPKFTQTLIEAGIIRLVVTEGSFLDVEDVLVIRKVNLGFSKGSRFCVLLDTSNGYFTASPEAMKMLSSPAYLDSRKATAIVVKSLAAKITGNFFRLLNPPHCPTRLFNSEPEALKWLRQF
jgi:hypothetical protein